MNYFYFSFSISKKHPFVKENVEVLHKRFLKKSRNLYQESV